MKAEEYLHDLILTQEEVTKAEQRLSDLRVMRDTMIYTANETHGIPLLQIAKAIGVRRDTVVLAKMRGEISFIKENEDDVYAGDTDDQDEGTAGGEQEGSEG